MEIFYSKDIVANIIHLGEEEAAHCVRVLRHRVGDKIVVMDGCGSMYECLVIEANPKHVSAEIQTQIPAQNPNYQLSMAVCPPKNIDRYEWFVEKATEIGLDSIVPVIGEHSERKIIKAERLERIILSASKQSLKSYIPKLAPCISVREYIESEPEGLRLICCCFEPEGGRKSITQVLKESLAHQAMDTDSGVQIAYKDSRNTTEAKPKINILIGPEGDFSEEELLLAISHSWIPISLGESRLRLETAALTSVSAVYLYYLP